MMTDCNEPATVLTIKAAANEEVNNEPEQALQKREEEATKYAESCLFGIFSMAGEQDVVIPPNLRQVTADLVGAVNTKPSKEMVSDHILVEFDHTEGKSFSDSRKFLKLLKSALEVVRHCYPLKEHKCEASPQGVIDTRTMMGTLRNSPLSSTLPFNLRYVLIENIHFFPLDDLPNRTALDELMAVMRVVTTAEAGGLPPHIRARFPIRVDLAGMQVSVGDLAKNSPTPLQEQPTESQSVSDGLMSNDKKAPEAAPPHSIRQGQRTAIDALQPDHHDNQPTPTLNDKLSAEMVFAPSIKGGLIEGKEKICNIYSVKTSSYDNTVAKKARDYNKPIGHLKGPNGPPSMYHDDIIFLKGTKGRRRPKK